MEKVKFIHEKEVWLIDFEPVKGIEIQKIRPAVVLRKFSKTHFVVLPMTSQTEKKNVFELNTTFLNKKSFVKIDQIRTVDGIRFIKKFGELSESKFLELKKISAKVFQLPPRGANAHNGSKNRSDARENSWGSVFRSGDPERSTA